MNKLLAAISNPVTKEEIGTLEGAQNNALGVLFVNVWRAIVIFGAILTLVYLIWGAIDWLTSDGEAEKLKNARGKIINAVVGMCLLAASVAIVYLIDSFNILGFSLLKLEWPTL